jgi:hypothetical protein
MPFDPEKLKQAQSVGQKPMTSRQATATFSAEKLKAAQDQGVNMDEEAAIRTGLKQAALPTALGVAGGMAGGLTGPLSPVAVPFLSAAGAMAGEFANQQLGITAQDPKQIALQGAVPLALGTAGNLVRPARALFPAATKGAEFLNRNAAPEMRSRLTALAGPDPAPLFNRMSQSGAMFDTGNTLPVIRQALGDLKQGANSQALYGRTIGILEGLENKLAQSGGRMDPKSFQAELRDLGAALRTAEGKTINKVEAGAINKVYGEMAESLDNAAQPPMMHIGGGQLMPAPPSAANNAARDLLEARRLVKRQSVLDELEESVGNADKILRGQGANTQFNAAAVLRDLKKNPFWTEAKGGKNPAFTASEKKDIEGLLEMMNGIPALQPGAGQAAGSFQVNKSIRSGLALGAASGAGTQDPLMTGAATLAGLAIPTAAEFGRVLNMALRTESGRQELRALLRQPGTTMQTIVRAFTTAAPAVTATPAPPMPMTMMPTPFAMEQ